QQLLRRNRRTPYGRVHAIQSSRELTENFVHHRPDSAQRMVFAYPCLRRQITEYMTLVLIFSAHAFLYHTRRRSGVVFQQPVSEQDSSNIRALVGMGAVSTGLV